MTQVHESEIDCQRPHDGNGAASHGDEEVIPRDLPRPSNFTVVIAVVVFLVLLAAIFFVGWLPHRHRDAEARADAAERQSELPTVSITKPKPAASSQDVLLPADLRPNQQTSLFARTTGYIKSLKVDIGDRVETGQLLAEIDAPEVDAQLAQTRGALELSKANVTKSESDYELAQRTRERYEEAHRDNAGGVTQQELDEKRSAERQAAASLTAAKANVVAAEADVQRLVTLQSFEKVTAPFSGTITARGYDVGALVNSTATSGSRELFRLAQNDPMQVYLNVPQTYATNIQVGHVATLRVRNYPDRDFQGVVARTSGALDPNTRTLTVELHFPNKTGELYPGMYGQVRLTVEDRQPVLRIPTSAIVFNAEGMNVATVRDDKVQFKKISVGRDLGTEIEIVNGLDLNDAVVSNPGERIAEGTSVRSVPMQDAAAAQGEMSRVR